VAVAEAVAVVAEAAAAAAVVEAGQRDSGADSA
jgi:hypothetical protein